MLWLPIRRATSWGLFRSSNGVNSLKPALAGPVPVMILRSATARLDRIYVYRLQELSLKKFADSGDLVPGGICVCIREKPMRRMTCWIDSQRFCCFDDRAVPKTQIIVDAREAGTTCRLILVQQQPQTVYCPVIRSARWIFEYRAMPVPAGSGSAS